MNVWAVLGIAPTSDETVIKRAYAAQLKLHRPQSDPEGFQRLREAYTWALRWGDRFEHDEDDEDERDSEPDADDDSQDRSDGDDSAAERDGDGGVPHDAVLHTPVDAVTGASVEPATPPSAQAPPSPTQPAAADTSPATPPSTQPAPEATLEPEPEAQPHLQSQVRPQPQASLDTRDADRARLLDAFSAITRLTSRNDVRRALHAWAADPALDPFDVRQALSHEVFERTTDWLAENAKRRRALMPAPEFVAPLEALFHWRTDELELSRHFADDDVERVLTALDPTRSLRQPTPGTRNTLTSLLKQVFGWIGLLVGLAIGINRCSTEDVGVREPLARAERAYADGDDARAIELAEAAVGADEFERGSLVVRAHMRLGQLDAARTRAEALLRESATLPEAHLLMGDVEHRLGHCGAAALQYEAAIQLQWSVEAGNGLAWALATCHEPGVRDGARAVDAAQRVVAAHVVAAEPTASYIDTLAAAWAERGDFIRAVREQQRALAAAGKESLDEQTLAGFRARLQSYQRRQPWREPPPAKPQPAKAGAGQRPAAGAP